MKKTKLNLQPLQLKKQIISSLQQSAVVGGAPGSDYLCVPIPDGPYYSESCPISMECPTQLCYSANNFMSQCCAIVRPDEPPVATIAVPIGGVVG